MPFIVGVVIAATIVSALYVLHVIAYSRWYVDRTFCCHFGVLGPACSSCRSLYAQYRAVMACNRTLNASTCADNPGASRLDDPKGDVKGRDCRVGPLLPTSVSRSPARSSTHLLSEYPFSQVSEAIKGLVCVPLPMAAITLCFVMYMSERFGRKLELCATIAVTAAALLIGSVYVSGYIIGQFRVRGRVVFFREHILAFCGCSSCVICGASQCVVETISVEHSDRAWCLRPTPTTARYRLVVAENGKVIYCASMGYNAEETARIGQLMKEGALAAR